MFIDFNIDKKVFKKDLLYKSPFLFKNSLDTTKINWNHINEIYSRVDFSHRDFKLMNGYEVPKEEYIEPYDNLGVIEYRCITSTLYKYLRDGATLVRNRIKNEPIVDHISRQIGNFAEARTITGGYAAFSSKSSYKSHWDTRDVYAVQLLGRKRWILKKPNFHFPLYMHQTKNFSDIKEPEDIYMDVILEAGDILYIPRGWWHDPLPLNEETFHLAVATFAPTGFDYVQWLQNISPNILDCRKNLTDFNFDENIIDSISQNISKIIKDKKFYDAFIASHLMNHNINSTLSLNILGNNKVKSLNDEQNIFINANLIYIFSEGFIIVNGNKLNVDNTSLELINFIYKQKNTTVQEIYYNFPKFQKEKIKDLLFNLAIENIIGLTE